jgi:predicted metal-dependent hydrolase
LRLAAQVRRRLGFGKDRQSVEGKDMGRFWAKAKPPSGVSIRRSARARRMTLRVSALDGRVTLTVPPRTSDRAAELFIEGQSEWIAAARAKAPEAVTVGIGVLLPLDGVLREVVAGPRARLRADRIEVPEGPGATRAVLGIVKVLARERIAARLAVHAGALEREVTRLTLRDTRGRWGSCTEAGAVMLSWRLILALPEVLDYVVAHEAAHLVEMNHSRAFWDVVERLCPDYRRHRAWLKAHGPALHRFRFD